MKDTFVVDASSTIKLFIEESGSEYARLFFGQLASGDPPLLYAPDLLYIECANIVRKYVSHHGFEARRARAALVTLKDLVLQAVPTQDLFQAAFSLSLRYQVSAYDASYLALAEGLRCPLVTEDVDLIRQVRAHSSTVLYRLAEVTK